jgi:hypothetical protein
MVERKQSIPPISKAIPVTDMFIKLVGFGMADEHRLLNQRGAPKQREEQWNGNKNTEFEKGIIKTNRCKKRNVMASRYLNRAHTCFWRSERMVSEKICPVCHNVNEDTALMCATCGALLEGVPTNLVSGPEQVSPVDDKSTYINTALIPPGGVGIHVAGTLMPYYLSIDKELIIGRQPGTPLEAVLDLTVLNAFDLGVSRRHALIGRTDTGFDVSDLGSRNGTWLNAKKLIPHQPYRLVSGSQLRLGRMQLFIVHRAADNAARKK